MAGLVDDGTLHGLTIVLVNIYSNVSATFRSRSGNFVSCIMRY